MQPFRHYQDARMMAASLCGLSSEENMGSRFLSLPRNLMTSVGTRYFMPRRYADHAPFLEWMDFALASGAMVAFSKPLAKIVILFLALKRWKNNETFQ